MTASDYRADRYLTDDGKVRHAQAHAARAHECSCGRTVYGNGGRSSHDKACTGRFLTWAERQERNER